MIMNHQLVNDYLTTCHTLNKDFQAGKIKVGLYRELWDREEEIYGDQILADSVQKIQCN
ncbi:MAG: hypothetical protein QG566_348 [Patescibacteria group bacterium]|nr:hypothetical protein [Patescibacteria group bacterium]